MNTLLDFYNKANRESVAFDNAMVQLSLLYKMDSQEFAEQFNQWIAELPISWERGIEILMVRFITRQLLPWS